MRYILVHAGFGGKPIGLDWNQENIEPILELVQSQFLRQMAYENQLFQSFQAYRFYRRNLRNPFLHRTG
jgi:hypothetical protein